MLSAPMQYDMGQMVYLAYGIFLPLRGLLDYPNDDCGGLWLGCLRVCVCIN